jgi:hypothetical protein
MFWSQPKLWAKSIGCVPLPNTSTLFLARISSFNRFLLSVAETDHLYFVGGSRRPPIWHCAALPQDDTDHLRKRAIIEKAGR